jgi:hypothetical protein
VVVELGLFCGYEAAHEYIWDVCPFNPKNSVNKAATRGVTRSSVYSRAAPAELLEVQLRMVRRIAATVKGRTNVFFSPLFTQLGGDQRNVLGTVPAAPAADVEWGAKIVSAIREVDPTRLVSAPPAWKLPGTNVWSYGSGGALGLSTTFRNISTACSAVPSCPNCIGSVRESFWCWFMAGAVAVSNLDWSYATHGRERGTLVNNQTKATASGPAYRRAVQSLARYVSQVSLADIAPNNQWVAALTPRDVAHRTTVFGFAPKHRGGRPAAAGQFGFYLSAADALPAAVAMALSKWVPATVERWRCAVWWTDPQSGRALGPRVTVSVGSADDSTHIKLPQPAQPTSDSIPSATDIAGFVKCGDV